MQEYRVLVTYQLYGRYALGILIESLIGVRLDSDTFSSLYRNAYPRLVVIAAALVHDRSEACDIVQQSAIIAIERSDQFLPTHETVRDIEFSRWMAAIVRNVASNVRRKNKVRQAISLNDADANNRLKDRVFLNQSRGCENGEDVGFDYGSKTFRGMDGAFDDQLRNGLQSLSEIGRICLLLNVVLHVTLDEIGQLLEIPSGTVASHVSRAKKSLRESLHDYRGSAS
jgi:RNA polymerase sigma factor (sigma-70 family)